jgi:hypothetical protein
MLISWADLRQAIISTGASLFEGTGAVNGENSMIVFAIVAQFFTGCALS